LEVEAMTPSGRDSLASNISRRDFLSLAGRGALWAAFGASLIALIRFLGFAEPEPAASVTLDSPDAYPPGTLTPVVDGRAFIGRDEHGLYAISAICTHLGCQVKQARQGFECPCHGSQFDNAGRVTQGPASQPLARAALSVDSEGRVVIDLRQRVDSDARLPAGRGDSP
jgi:cytochrome b6-f complex iron-sulfur subunit